MMLLRIACSLPVLICLLATSVLGQRSPSLDTGDIEISQSAFQRQIRRIQADNQIDEEVGAASIAEYEEALRSLASAASFGRELARFRRDQNSAGQLIRSLRGELAKPDTEERLSLPGEASAAQINQALTQASADLEARRQALSQLDQVAQRRIQRRQEIAERIGTLNQEVYELDEIRLSQTSAVEATLRRAREAKLLARRRAALAEIAAMRGELLSYDARAELIPLRRDRAQRRVAASTAQVLGLEQLNREETIAESERYFADIRTQCAKAIESHPTLAGLAEEVQTYADLLAGSSGVQVRAERTARRLTSVRGYIAQLNSIFQLTKRKFEAVGMLGTASQWFPQLPSGFPEIPQLASEIRSGALQVPEVEHQLIVLEETRGKLSDLRGELEEYAERLASATGGNPDSETVLLAKGLLTLRRELLDRLLAEYTRYSSQLRDLDTSSRELLDGLDTFRIYLSQRVMWVRSIQGSLLPSPSDSYEALLWVVANPEWGESLSNSLTTAWENLFLVLVCLLLLVALIAARPRLLRRLVLAGESAAAEDNLSYRPTLEASSITLLVALPLPMTLYLLGRFLEGSAPTEVSAAVGGAFRSVAFFGFVFEVLAQSLRRGGLAEKHFGWNSEMTAHLLAPLRRNLPVMMSSGFICLVFSHDILEFVGTQQEVAYLNSLGRMAFLVFSLSAALLLYRILRPRVIEGVFRQSGGLTRGRTWTRFVWLPLLASMTLLCIGLAVIGFYLTSYILIQRITRTLLFVICLFLVKELVHRWRVLRRKREAARLEALERSEEEFVIDGVTVGSEKQVDLESADWQVRRFVKIGSSIVALVGLVLIWSDLIPSLSILERVEIWPEIALLSEEELAETLSGNAAQIDTGAASGDAESSARVPSPLGPPLQDTTSVSASPNGGSLLTLAGLLYSIAALVLTILLSRAIPGLLEFVILQRLPLDSGDRYAIGTIAKYIVLFSGLGVTATNLGLSWSSIQWLAAAFSFGLAFGLQEIFANFVSGLIILFERPMRVGDAVEIGELSGIVSKVRMRATTITTWNRSELVVPNKEFITGKLINWTLSNRCARVEVPVCVKYGSDVQEVKDVLLEIGRSHPEALEDPKPFVIFNAFGERGLLFELRVYIDYSYGRLSARDELHTSVERAFAERDITFAFPQLDLHLSDADDAAVHGPLSEGSGQEA